MNPSDPGRVVPVLLPTLLDSRDHCSVDRAAVKGLKRSPVLVVFAPTGNRGSVGEPRGLDIADVSAVAPALPEVLLVLGIGVFRDSQPAESLPGEVLPPKPSAPAGFDVSGMELVGVDLDDLPADASALVDLRGVILPTRVLDDRQITVLPSDFAVHQTYIVASKKRRTYKSSLVSLDIFLKAFSISSTNPE